MPIVNINEMLQKAIKGKYAILHVNVINYDMARTCILTANETNSPLIVAVSQKALDNCFPGVKFFADMVKTIVHHEKIQVPIAIILDHGKYESVLEAIDAGFTAVMYDGSKLPLVGNLTNTKFIVSKAKTKNVSVECEVGAITGKVEDHGAPVQLASIEECKAMVSTGIDCLAAGIGNLHGNYPTNWSGLDFERLKEINQALPKMPLVLHGGSGIPEMQIKKAISLGVCKFNVGTELLTAFTTELLDYFISGKYKDQHGYDPRNYFPVALAAVKKVVIDKLTLLGSLGKA